MDECDMHVSVQCAAVRLPTCMQQQVESGPCIDVHSATSVQLSVC